MSAHVYSPTMFPRRRWRFHRGAFVMTDQQPDRLIEMKVTLGSILAILTVAGSACYYTITAAGRADQAAKDLIDYQLRASTTIVEFKASVDKQFDGLNRQLDNMNAKTAILPTQQARLEQLLKQHDEDLARLGQLDGRIGSLEQRAAQTSTMLENILRPNILPTRNTR